MKEFRTGEDYRTGIDYPANKEPVPLFDRLTSLEQTVVAQQKQMDQLRAEIERLNRLLGQER